MSDLYVETWWWPYVMILVAGALATNIWRWIGVFAAGRVREDSELLIWVRSVATALIAAIISKLILFPEGALAATPMALRFLAAAWGFATFLFTRQNLLASILTSELVLISGWFLLEI